MKRQCRGLSVSIMLLTLIAIAGCSSSTGTTAGDDRQRLFISTQEIQEMGQGVDLHSLVQRVRPMWLIKSGPHSGVGNDDIRVYVSGMRFDNPSALRFYNGVDAKSLTFLEPGRATARYGIGHSHGAIIVEMYGGGYEAP